MRHFPIIFLTLLLLANTAFAQKVVVKEETQKINGKSIAGYSIVLQAAKDKAESSLLAFLKENGKTENKRTYYHLREIVFPGIYSTQISLFATTTADGTQARVWMGVDTTLIEKTVGAKLHDEAQTFLYNFGIKYYRDEVQRQIEEAERATEFTSKNYQKLINENTSLAKQLENAKAEKIRLEKALESNIKLQEELALKLVNNKSDQDSVYLDIESMKKALEVYKRKLGEIE